MEGRKVVIDDSEDLSTRVIKGGTAGQSSGAELDFGASK